MKVWTYWEGPRWPHIDLCLASIAHHCRDLEYQHVTPANMHEFIPKGTLHPNWRLFRHNTTGSAMRCDCIRAALLKLHGGLYIDADTLMLESPWRVINEQFECMYIKWTNAPERVSNGVIYCCPNSSVAEYWLEGVNYSLGQGQQKWTGLGEKILTPIMKNISPSLVHQWDMSTWFPIEVDCEVAKFFDSNTDWKNLITNDTVAFGLNHSWMVGRRASIMRLPMGFWNQSSLLIHQLFAHVRDTIVYSSPA